MVQLLLKHGADPQARDKQGWTVLMNARGSDLEKEEKTVSCVSCATPGTK
jgi:ankyrin repeat protein